MKIIEFHIEESKVNKGCLNLIAVAEDGNKYVVSGNYHDPTYLVPYEKSWDTTSLEEKKNG